MLQKLSISQVNNVFFNMKKFSLTFVLQAWNANHYTDYLYIHLFSISTLKFVHRASPVVLVVKNLPASEGDMRHVSWVRKIPWRRHGNPHQYSCLVNPHGQRSLVGYSSEGHKEPDMTEVTQHTYTHTVVQKTYLIMCLKIPPVTVGSIICMTYLIKTVLNYKGTLSQQSSMLYV